MIAAVSILLIVLVILSALMHYALARARYQREERLREWAAELGLNVSVQRDGVPDQPYGRFAIFNSGMEQHQLLTISGQLDFTFGDQTRTCDVLLGDIEQIDEAADAGMPWWLGLLAGPSKHRFSYLLMRLPFADVPAMRIRHRFGPGGIGAIAGWDTIETEWMDFNRSMQIATRDRRFASALISKRMMEFLVDQKSWPISIEGEWMSMSDAGSTWTATEFCNTVDWLRSFLALWPEHLVATMSEARASSTSAHC